MRFTIRILGAEVLHVDTEPTSDDNRGDAVTTMVNAPDTELTMGFTNGRESEE